MNIKYIIKNKQGKMYKSGLTPDNIKFSKNGKMFDSLSSLKSTLKNMIIHTEKSIYFGSIDAKALKEEIQTWELIEIMITETVLCDEIQKFIKEI